MRCFVVAGFLLTSASRGPSAIAEPLVISITICVFNVLKLFFDVLNTLHYISTNVFVIKSFNNENVG